MDTKDFNKEELDKMWQNIDCRKLLAHTSHDLRSSLNNVLGLTKLAKSQLDDRDYVEYCLEKIDDSAHLLLNMLNDILYTISLEDGKACVHDEVFNMQELYEGVSSHIKAMAYEKKLHFYSHIDDDVAYFVDSDRGRIQQILQNLLTNAVKFTPRYGKVEFQVHQLGLAEDKASFEFIVRDSGIGIAEELQDKIFLPMTKEYSDSTAVYGGIGLGLALCKRLTDLLGGRLEFKSAKGQGSEFRLYLDLPVDHSRDGKAAEDSERPYHFAGKTVLLAEDNDINAEIVKRLLSKLGLLVDTAGNGSIALNKYMMNAPGSYDLVLMDVRMPLMDGLEAARRVRASGKSDAKRIPIVAMTANAYEKDIQKSLEAGMNAHLTKPVEPELLYETVKRALGGEL